MTNERLVCGSIAVLLFRMPCWLIRRRVYNFSRELKRIEGEVEEVGRKKARLGSNSQLLRKVIECVVL